LVIIHMYWVGLSRFKSITSQNPSQSHPIHSNTHVISITEQALRHPLEKFETEPISFDKIWHYFCREVDSGTSQIWRPQISLPRAYLPLELTYKR
jgi:hypothetical protein